MKLFASALFVSAALLFSLQPMVSKMLLPHFGGAPAVWITAMCFFQALLLAGYSYAHLLCRLRLGRQLLTHLAVLTVPLALLPFSIPDDWSPPGGANPVPYLLGYLVWSVGVPFFVVCTTAPLLQGWFAATMHRQASDPYVLYTASNLGSFLGLLSYPALVEPLLTLHEQARVWAAGYGLLLVLIAASALAVWRGPRPAPVTAPAAGPTAGTAPLSWRARFGWVVCAFVPSSLLLGVTNFLTIDVAPVPLLWVVPLSLYLLTFVLAFGHAPAWVGRAAAAALPVFLVLQVALLVARSQQLILAEVLLDIRILGPVHLVSFFLVALVFHGRLAGARPATRHLTEFYLWISAGGVLGGLFNALLAPQLFTTFVEYPLILVLAALLLPGARPVHRTPRQWALDLGLPALLLVVSLFLQAQAAGPSLLGSTLPAMACLAFVRRPLRLGLGLAAVLLASAVSDATLRPAVYRGRNFFGPVAVWVSRDGRTVSLSHGQTLHGMQLTGDLRKARRVPTTYYFPTGPAGKLFEHFQGRWPRGKIAVVGLGAGTLASYGQPGQHWTFFEIDPIVVQVAHLQFSFLRDSRASWDVKVVDGRLGLAEQPDGQFDLIVLDAFTSDSIPTHLVTREAVALYRSKLAPEGLLLCNLTNKYLNLSPVLAGVGEANGLVGRVQFDNQVSAEEARLGKQASFWIVLARDGSHLGPIAGDPGWLTIPPEERRVWTDDYSNLLGVFAWLP
jgi:hypothetical protein